MSGALVRGVYRGVKTAIRHPVIYPRIFVARGSDDFWADTVAAVATPLIENFALKLLGYDENSVNTLSWIRMLQMGTTEEGQKEIRIKLK